MSRKLPQKAVFLDRDGVIIKEPPHYPHLLEHLNLIPNTINAIKLFNELNYLVIIVTNQAGVAHGFFTEKDAQLFNKQLTSTIKNQGGRIDAIYYCPHHPNAKLTEYKIICQCRKPKIGMLQEAKAHFNLAFNLCFLIGDKKSDIDAGKKAGCKTVLVKTGYGAHELNSKKINCDIIALDLFNAAKKISKIQ